MSTVGLFAAQIQFFVALRQFRILRLAKIKKRFKQVVGTAFELLPQLISYVLALVVVFYVFAIIGMEAFAGKLYKVGGGDFCAPLCCFPRAEPLVPLHPPPPGLSLLQGCCGSYYEGWSPNNTAAMYYLNNFDSLTNSYITLFELMVVNNWFVIMDGVAAATNDWSRVYFFTFYIVIVVVVINVVVAFILETFLSRMHVERSFDTDLSENRMRGKNA